MVAVQGTNKEINGTYADCSKRYERNEFMKTNLLGEMAEGLLYQGKLGKLGNMRCE